MYKDMFRTGTVQTVNEKRRTARVMYYMYPGMMSAELRVIYQSESWMPKVNDEVLCLCPPEGDGDGYIVGRC